MRPIRTFPWPAPHGDTVLSALLVATLLAPLPAAAWGASLPTPFGLARDVLFAAGVALGAAYIWWRWRRSAQRGAAVAVLVAALTGALSVAIARIIELRASRFYTEEALFEGVAVLLGLHVTAGLLRLATRAGSHDRLRATRHGRVRTWWRARDGRPVTAAGLASVATDGVALLFGASWACMAFNARDVALALMAFAGGIELLVVLFCIPDAILALPRWTKPVVALLAFASCATPGSATTLLPPLAPAAVAPGCAVQAIDTAPLPVPATPAANRARRSRAPARAVSLRLNVPAYRLDLVVDSAVVASYGVAVGMRKYRTPTGAFAVHRIVWNPWWVPPKSEWARKDTVTPPGPANPMGRVKLLIGGPYYMHGTPAEASIGKAASHGCIRMRNQDAIALARELLAIDGAGPDDDELLYVLADTVSVAMDLPRPVLVNIAYAIAELRGDTLLLHPDVYRRAGGRVHEAAMRALLAGAYDTTRVRRRVLAAAVRRSRSRHVAVRLDSLLLQPPARTPIIARVP